MTTPITKYAPSEGGYVAYQVFGSGPINVVFVTSWVTNVDVMWEEPHTPDSRSGWTTCAR